MVIITEQRELKSKNRRTLTPKISLTILSTVCHKILMVSIWRIWYCINLKSPNWVFFFILLTYLLDSWYCRKKFCFDHSWVKALSGETLLTKLGLMSVLISWDGGWGLRPKSQSEVKQIEALQNYLPTLHWKLFSWVITPKILEILPQPFFQLNMLGMIQWWSHQIWQR